MELKTLIDRRLESLKYYEREINKSQEVFKDKDEYLRGYYTGIKYGMTLEREFLRTMIVELAS